jgi:uncharacterized protein (TIGR02757 family)
MNIDEIKDFLDEKVMQYNNKAFVETDPISIPHRFEKKEDIEISGFLTATISWGNRKSIIKSASRMLSMMDNAPYDFVLNYKTNEPERVAGFVHRTFNETDLNYFIRALKNIYLHKGGLENIFTQHAGKDSILPAIHMFKKEFFSILHPERTKKHISDPENGSVAKRINMFLRWMVRRDNHGVDFGLWKNIPPSILSCPLDIHSGNVARKLGLITRNQNDLKALSELDNNLRLMDKNDPVKYDYALFGLGVFENF